MRGNKNNVKKSLLYMGGAVLGGYVMVQNRQLTENKYELKCRNLPQSFIGRKILLLSDLHNKTYGDNFSNLLDSCVALSPDYIFFTGDLYSRHDTNMDPKKYLMKRLSKIAPVYYCMGNHELYRPADCDRFCGELSDMGINVLRNGCVKITENSESLNVYGLEIGLEYYKNADGTYKDLPELTADDIGEMLGKADKNACNLLLAHDPRFFESYAEWGADAVFSGHCHGGIIRLPLIGGILSPERKFFPKYTKGVYTLPDCRMVVSAGLGKFRLNNPSEIVLITLKGE